MEKQFIIRVTAWDGVVYRTTELLTKDEVMNQLPTISEAADLGSLIELVAFEDNGDELIVMTQKIPM